MIVALSIFGVYILAWHTTGLLIRVYVLVLVNFWLENYRGNDVRVAALGWIEIGEGSICLSLEGTRARCG